MSFGLFGLLSIPLQIIFSAYCFKRLFNLNITSIIIKTLLFLLMLFILFIIASIITAVIMFLNGSFEEIREAQSQTQST